MENATKALLIAAAVLVAILIISLGIGIFNMASEQVNNAGDLSEYEIQKFNEKFTQYEGTSVSASDVNALIKTAFNHNLSEEDPSRRVRVGFNGGGNGNGTPNTSTGGYWLVMREQFYEDVTLKTVPAGNRYTVQVHYDPNSKLIDQINVNTN